MGAMTKAELEAMVKRLQESLDRADAKVAKLDKSLGRAKSKNRNLHASLRESLDREKATAEILRVVRDSPNDAQPVFEAIAHAALRLFEGVSAAVTRVDGDTLHLGGFTSTNKVGDEAVKALFPSPISAFPGGHWRTIRTRAPCVIADTEKWPDSQERWKETARVRGFRSAVFVPLLRRRAAIGTIGVSRREPGSFGDHEIELLRTFADQAVVAIENARLFNETKRALEQQTAVSEILSVISSSPTDVQPVYDAIVRSAVTLCGATLATVYRLEAGLVHLVGIQNEHPDAPRVAAAYPAPVSSSLMSCRAIRENAVIQVPDVEAEGALSLEGLALARLSGFRSVLSIPLRREGLAIGAILVGRPIVGVFPDEHVALLKTFADQAVIAIENVRLFNETMEALQQQTVISEVLRIISSSPTDTQPVFDAIVKSGVQLFGGMSMTLRMIRGEHTVTVAGSRPVRDDTDGEWPTRLADMGAPTSQAIARREVVQVADLLDAEDWVGPLAKKRGELGGFRALMCAPLLREGRAIGAINVIRAMPGAFSDKQIALLQTFADQAVIAIENVRLFKELEARNAELTQTLERQTAMGEILTVISATPADVNPVFETILKNAVSLCGSPVAAIFRVDGGLLHLAATHNWPREALADVSRLFPAPPSPTLTSGRVVLSGSVVRVSDVLSDPDYDHALAKKGSWRRMLGVPLLRDGKVIGVINLGWSDPGDTPKQQVELLQTFASQAVIAIQNVRPFKELEARNAEITEALKQQTATAEILQVISSSPTDLQPVFDAILDKATQLCDSNLGILGLYDGEHYQFVAVRAGDAEVEKWAFDRGPFRANPGSPLSQLLRDGQPFQIADVKESAEYRNRRPMLTHLVERVGVRTHLGVPMLKEGRAVGSIHIYRPEVRPFTQKEIDLVGTFANQAVIAIENVRLFKELRAQTEALSRSVKQLTALGEVGQAISSSLDLETVLKTIVSRALMLTGLDAGSIYEYDPQAQVFHLQATENIEAEIIEAVRTSPIQFGDGVVGRTGVTREITQVPDILDPNYQSERRDLLVRAGYRALLAVPLLRDEQLLGVLLVSRKTPGAFAPETVDLLKTFATQSALAIQNARLFREIAEKGRQLQVASQHKSQFLASMSHELRTPLNAILGFNEMMLDGLYGEISEDLKDPLQETQTSGRHLLRLINNVLDLAKIEAGRMELALTDYAVQDMVESVRSTLRPLAEAKGLEFNVAVPIDIPLAYGDAGRLTQCLMNLAGNSLKFTKEGQVAISVAATGDILTFRVVDTGIGIAPEKIDSLFTEFKQTDATIASEYGGTGLGLAITRQFIEMHGGRIWVESEPGKGSTFIFEIPLRAQAT